MPSAQSSALETGRHAPVMLLTDSLEKPSIDDRDYRVIRLENDLEVLLVHDPETDKASAALDVGVGCFSDEDGMPGMAHAVEHVSRESRYPSGSHITMHLPLMHIHHVPPLLSID